MSEHAKITARHRQHRAVVYVRQSTPGQVERNTESSVRQYALAERAVELGWPPESVVVVDGDTGRSAAWASARIGFRELVAEVGLGNVGLILALEVSRLARSSADWHQLLDLCALTGTLICDGDGIYSPAEFNDRLLLALKGTMSEAELHLIRSRLRGGIENKARRGELRLNLPIGLDRTPEGRIQLTADEQVRAAIQRVYAFWRRCASARQVVSELDGERQLLPRRTVGDQRVRWEPASFGAVHDLLTNPVYAGALVYGRTRQRKTVDPDGQIRTRTELLAISEWRVCLPDHHPGYVSWGDYLATQDRLRANARGRGEGGGAAREGSALLQGLVRCGRCGRRMMVAYSGTNGRSGRYLCSRTFQQQGTRRPCQGIGALRVDRTVAKAFLDAVTPAGLDATARALETLQTAHDDRVRLQRLAVERADYDAERARRQYDACEPEHRLVARTLEHVLEIALAALARQQRALHELERQRPAPLTDSEQRALARLAADLPRIWDAPTTSDRDRKQLLRCLLDDVVLTVDREHYQARVELFWQGGARSEHPIALNRTPAKRTDTPGDLIELIRRLAEHSPDREIAMILAKQGHRTATGLPFTATRVAGIRERADIPAGPQRPITREEGVSVHEAARQLGVCTQTIRRWLREGLLPAQQTTPHAPWRIKLTDDIRRRFIAEAPAGYVRLADAAATPDSRARRSSTRSAAATVTPSTSHKPNAADSVSNSTPKNTACWPHQRPAPHDDTAHILESTGSNRAAGHRRQRAPWLAENTPSSRERGTAMLDDVSRVELHGSISRGAGGHRGHDGGSDGPSAGGNAHELLVSVRTSPPGTAWASASRGLAGPAGGAALRSRIVRAAAVIGCACRSS